MTSATSSPTQRQFACRQCGASLQFAPGTSTLVCPYCGTANDTPQSGEHIAELDLRGSLSAEAAAQATHEVLTVKCGSCGAETLLPPNVVAQTCPFCGSPIVAGA